LNDSLHIKTPVLLVCTWLLGFCLTIAVLHYCNAHKHGYK